MLRTSSRPALAAVAFVFAICPVAAADWTVVHGVLPSVHPETNPLAAAVTATAHGDFDGDRVRDVAAVASGRLALFSAPSHWASLSVLDESLEIADVAALRGFGGGYDAIATIGAAGVQRWLLDPSQPDLSFAPALLAGGALQGGTKLRARALPGLAPELAAVAADGVTVKRVYRDPVNWAQETCVVAGGAVLDLELLDWGSGSGLDVAVLTATTLEVRALASGQLHANASWSGTFEGIEVVRHRGAARDQLAVVERLSDGTRTLRVLGDGRAESPLALPVSAIGGLAAADSDQDGDSELFVAHRDGPAQLVLVSQSTTSAASASYSLLTAGADHAWVAFGATGADFTTNDAPPQHADFDGDGDPDLFLACRPSGTAAVGYASSVDAAAQRLRLAAGFDAAVHVYDYSSWSRLDLGIARPPQPGTHTHVELVAWNAKFGEEEVEPRPLAQASFAIPSDWASVPLSARLWLPSSFAPGDGDGLVVHARLVTIANGAYASAGPMTAIRVEPTDAEFAAAVDYEQVFGTSLGEPVPFPDSPVIAPIALSDDPDPLEPDTEPASAQGWHQDVSVVLLPPDADGVCKGRVKTGGAVSDPRPSGAWKPKAPVVPPSA